MKTSKILYLFALIILLIFVGAFSTYATYISIIFSALIALLIAIKADKDDYTICYGIILLLVCQNLCIGFGAHLFSNKSSSLMYLTQIPTLVVLIIWLSLQIKQIKSDKKIKIKSKKWFFGILLCIAYSYIRSHGTLSSIISTTRNLTFFYMIYEIGLTYINDEFKLKKFYIFFNKLIKFLFFIGIVFLVAGYNLYEFFGVNEILLAKGSSELNGYLSHRYVTNIMSFYVPRLSSLYFEPVNLAYLFAFSFILNIYYDERKIGAKIFDVIISALGLLLTFGKGGYLIVLLTILYDFGTRFGKRIKNKTRSIIVASIIVVFVLVFLKLYLSKYTSSYALPHIWAIQNTFKSILNNPLGYGLGKGGNAARIFNSIEGDYLASGGESALMSFAFQIGMQGVLFILLCFKDLLPFKNISNNKFLKIMKFLPFVILAVAIFQENTFTPQCITIYMLVIGALYSINHNNKLGGLYERKKS